VAPNIVVRALWFLLVGWWLTPVVLFVAWLLHIPIVTIPIGVVLVNQTPRLLTLKPPSEVAGLPDPGEVAPESQYPLLVRAVWFVFVGSWLSLTWVFVASLFAVTIIGLPVAIWMLNRLPFVLSLYRY
jgi:uncharacterized membrane protein YccF (DUF307 family)